MRVAGKKPPKWERKGYKSEAEYRAACAATKRTKDAALLATKASKKSVRLALRVLWGKAEFDRPIVAITKEQLMAEVDCSLPVIKQALAELRAEGSIIPINLKGGRGVPSRYRLSVAGHKTSPSQEQFDAMRAEKDREAAWRFLKDKYGPMRALEIMDGKEE